MTATGKFLGTLDYVSPEQISGKPVDARSDVYSLACVFFHALVGAPPFGNRDAAAKLYGQLHEPPPSVRGTGIPEVGLLEEVFNRALDKDPRRRYPSAGDFTAAFESALKGEANTKEESFGGVGYAAPKGEDETKVLPRGRPATRRWLAVAVPLAVASAVAVTTLVLYEGSRDSQGRRVTPDRAAGTSSGGVDRALGDSRGLASIATGTTGSHDLFGAPIKGGKATSLDRGGTKETTIAAYCSPSGDFCQSVFDRSGEVILEMAQFSFGPGQYKICLTDPARKRQCETFKWFDAGSGLYQGEVNLLDAFEVATPGTYSAAWTANRYQVGKALRFRMLSAVPGGGVNPGDVSGYIAQLGSFKTRTEAEAFRSDLYREGFESGVLRSAEYDELEPGYWVVFAGPFATQEEADESATASDVDGAFGRPIE